MDKNTFSSVRLESVSRVVFLKLDLKMLELWMNFFWFHLVSNFLVYILITNYLARKNNIISSGTFRLVMYMNCLEKFSSFGKTWEKKLWYFVKLD